MKLVINENLKSQLNSEMIEEADIINVIQTSLEDNNYIKDIDTGHLTTHLKIGYITCWVEFAPCKDDSYEIFKVYTHRMEIKED